MSLPRKKATDTTPTVTIMSPKIYIVLTTTDDGVSPDGIPFVDEESLLEYIGSLLTLVPGDGDTIDLGFTKTFTILQKTLMDFKETTPSEPVYPKPHVVHTVDSRSRPDLQHQVWENMSKELYYCSCEAFKFHPNKGCPHMLEIMIQQRGTRLAPTLVVHVPS